VAKNTILLVGVEPRVEAELRAALRDALLTALPDLEPGKEEGRALAAQAAIAVVSVSGDRRAPFRLVSPLATAGTHVIVIGPDKDPDLILRAMREGAREYLTAGETEKVVNAIRAQARPPAIAGSGSVVAVFPAKGGVGATSIATNLAGACAQNGDRACLLDLDLAMGDALAFLDLTGGYAISDVIANMQRIDRGLLDASVLRHRSGVHVLAQTEKMQEAAGIDPASVTSLIHFLRQHYKFSVLDGLRTLDDHGVAALDACDHVLLVVTQEVPAVRRAQRCVSFLRQLGHDDARLHLIVNRYSKTAEVKSALIAETVGLPVSATIASDYPALIRSVNRGSLLQEESPRSQLTRDIEALRTLIGYTPEHEERPSLLKRFFNQKVVHAT
jgi:pilus assembly protein CpaE